MASPMTPVTPIRKPSPGWKGPRRSFSGGERKISLENGEMLQGVFRIERFVASGGMGQVFRARDLRLERPVAVKVLHGRLLESGMGLKRFQREARSLSRVVHPNVVALRSRRSRGKSISVMELWTVQPLRPTSGAKGSSSWTKRCG